MTTRDSAVRFRDQLVERAKTIRNTYPIVEMMFFLLSKDNIHVFSPAMSEVQMDKGEIADFVRKLSGEVDASYVIHVCECWVSHTLVLQVSVKDRPDAYDAISVSIDGPDINETMIIPILAPGEYGEASVLNQSKGGTFYNLSGNIGAN